LLVVKDSVTGTVPVFLTYTVLVNVLPGLRVPTWMLEQGWVQPESEYTSTLTAVIVPSRSTFWEELRAAIVVSVRKVAIMTADTAAICSVLRATILTTWC
jgi:hypothetical protein